MAESYSWAETRERAAEAFGGRYPDAELEQEIIDVFCERPAFVIDAIASVVVGYEAGRLHSPWPFLRKKVTEAPADVVVSDTRERDVRISRARAFIANAGLHIASEAELVSELFEDTGRLRAYRSDVLEAEMVELWREAQPIGEQLEREAQVRISAQVDALERIGQGMRTTRPRTPDGSFASPLDDWGAV